jgi:hypothetical protein
MVLKATLNNISVICVAVISFGGGNRSTRRKPLTCRKSLTNLMLYRVHLATNRVCTHNFGYNTKKQMSDILSPDNYHSNC